MARNSIPFWLKVAYTVWLVVWVTIYWKSYGPQNFLWLCDLANLVIGIAIWRESPLLFSSQAVSVLIIQAAWIVDVSTRLVLGFHPIGGTEYMFEPATPLALRSLSLFHIFVPVLLLWAINRLGYDRRGWKLQTAILWLVLPVTYWLAEPATNINWLWKPFGVDQTLLPQGIYVLALMAAGPLLFYLPTHAALSRWARRNGGDLLPRPG